MSKTAHHDNSRKLDQFYTNPIYAEKFFNAVKNNVNFDSFDIFLEPSAGSGNFYNLFDENKRIGLDLDPQHPEVLETDFFKWKSPFGQKIITIGNPPFGKNSNLAVKFFNQAAKFSHAIAFILPKTFRKESIINRLDENFHLIYDESVPEFSFLFKDKPYDVWCCAQIWIKREEKRPQIKIIKLDDLKDWFEIVEPEQADFSIQRVGGRAGLIRTENFKNYSKESHYFIKAKNYQVLDLFKKIDFSKIKFNTAGNPSISPSELSKLWLEEASKEKII